MIDGKRLQADMRKAHLLGDDAVVGVVSVGCKAVSVDGREIVGIATSDSVDCESEVVLPDGADLSYINANKNLFVDHSYDVGSWVGKIRRLWRQGSGWMYRAFLFEGTRNPMAEDMLTIAKQAEIGASIGFEALDWGAPSADEKKKYPKAKSIVRRWKWLELSLTAMPCNVDCQGAVYTGGEKSAKIEALAVKGAVSTETVKRLGFRSTVEPKPLSKKTIVLLDEWYPGGKA